VKVFAVPLTMRPVAAAPVNILAAVRLLRRYSLASKVAPVVSVAVKQSFPSVNNPPTAEQAAGVTTLFPVDPAPIAKYLSSFDYA